MRLLQNWILIGLAAILLVACGGDSQGDLDDASQLALEIGIVSTLAGQNAIFNPTPISDSLRNRIEKLGNIQMRNSTYGMMFSDHLISENGPLPPSGPPNSAHFSRRNDMQPSPPSPLLT